MEKTALITGCSSGIGRAAAQLFAARGWNVAATTRDPSSLASWAHGENVATFPLDVTDEKAIATAVAATASRFGTIDVLVNNAGYGLFGPFEGTTAGQLERQFHRRSLGLAALRVEGA